MKRNGTTGALLAALLLIGVTAAARAAEKNSYQVTILKSNEAEDNTVGDPDPLLQNSWGIAASGTSPWWVSNNGSNSSTLYTGDGTKLSLEVSVPGAPTGMVFNSGTSFPLANSVKASFIWATEDGRFFGWNNGSGTTAEQIFNDPGSSYKGLAIHGDTLFSTDFGECQVEAFQFINGAVMEVETAGDFEDETIPGNYCPFGIQAVGDSIFVTYAVKGGEDDVAGQGHGLVREFDTDGNLVAEVADHGQLNSPWGVALAPANFGRFSGCLLVGNFGDGRINAYCKDDEGEWHHGGALREGKRPLVIDGLWGIGFGNDHNSGPSTTLYFAAGPDEETNGYFGKIEAVP
ncbi:MAG TPA: TIGR03118 family protein [Thermoanaerobaculia bacterium]|nr:TIGR03118 family protein [Thermoanaerobaculia bacterium]